MNMDELNKILNYREMQEMLPDYVFGRLNQEDKALFESNLPNYPDIRQEIAQVSEVFAKVEEMDFDKIIESKARNLSVRVKDRMRKRKKFSTYSWTMKYAVPTMAVAVLVFYTYLNKGEKPGDGIATNPKQVKEQSVNVVGYLTKADAELIFADGIDIDELHSVYSNLSTASSYNDIATLVADNPKVIENIYYEHLSEQFKELKPNDLNSIYDKNGSSMNGIYNELEKLDESDIQSLIEDVKNVRI